MVEIGYHPFDIITVRIAAGNQQLASVVDLGGANLKKVLGGNDNLTICKVFET